MASIRKRNGKWQVQVRRIDQTPVTKSFNELRDAKIWAREKEVEADRGHLEHSSNGLDGVTLS